MQAHAAGYKLEFQSPSVLADAGEAAVVEDAGTNWYNAAGLVYLPQQLVFSGIQMYQVSKFSGTATTPSPLGFTNTASGSDNSYITPYLPAFHYSLPIADRYALGLSIAPAWGLLEDWSDSSFLRYDLTRIYTRTLNVSPSIAFKINNQWSVGAGPDFAYFSLQSRSHAMTELAPGLVAPQNDSISRVSVDNWGKGYHLGVLFRPNETTRIGLNYRSKIVMNMNGYSFFGLNGVTTYETNQFVFRTLFPPVTTLSIYHDMNYRWAMMGTISYEQWGMLKNNYAQNYQSITPLGASNIINVAIPEGYHNTLDLGIGTHYQLCDNLMLRGSIKYVATPTKDSTRNIDFPDAAKLGLNLGFRYQINKKIAVDGIYAHVFAKSAPINNTNSVTGANVNGHVNTSIDLIGAQLVWNV